MKELSFIGTGKMASAIAKGICLNGVLTSEEIIGTAPDQSRFDFRDLTNIPVSDDNAEAMNSRMVVLAFKPQVAEQICRSLQPMVKDQYFVSICAGITLDNLEQWLGTDKVTRTMPNTPLCVSKGAVAYCSASGVGESDLALLTQYFECSGILAKVAEDDINTITALSGSGPAYVFEMIDALAQSAKANGLSDEVALAFSIQTFLGSAQMLSDKLGTPEELRNAVTSPNGTTYAALENFKQNNLREVLHQGFQAAKDRGDELSRGEK
ncbi:pyrroline-5-carboxylate reductase [Lentisphaera araneosa HTCC2155]|uniref:Pyrroline-5-carboxylate reductase n=1 Tax=Lentisphaera araneosa HTCC2155 TaxID=313628 RepID=A6DTF8_9BACT|nr:pyrroline-5-carboxylate reductase [Lentisphaera araneosa]EDM25062.1 pyrroline-5-carboxylate reductase [Lentisphaera araneosa HTCC2155]